MPDYQAKEDKALPRNEAPEATAGGPDQFLRWAIPAAAAVAIAVGGFWWLITLRQEASPVVHLRDGDAEVAISANGRSLAFRELPAALQDAVSEAFRTGKIPLSAGTGEANSIDLKAAERVGNGSHLVLGVAKARAGLAAEPAQEFRVLAEQNPNAELPKRLLGQAEARPLPGMSRQ